MKCGLCVKDIHEENNPMVKWYPKIKSEKTSRQGTTHVTVWNCPFCLGEYISTNYVQVNNQCRIAHLIKVLKEFNTFYCNTLSTITKF